MAAAVVGGAGAVVTRNVTDFPAERLPAAVQVLGPETFAANTVEPSPTRAVAAIQAIAARTGRTGRRLSAADVLDGLALRYGMDRAVELLRPFIRG